MMKLVNAFKALIKETIAVESWISFPTDDRIVVRVKRGAYVDIDYANQEIWYISPDGELKEIPAHGQWTRANTLREIAKEKDNKGAILKIAKSLVVWKTEEVVIDVFGHRNLEVPRFMREAGVEGSELTYLGQIDGVRRSMPLKEVDYKLVKVIDQDKLPTAEELSEEFESIVDALNHDGFNGKGSKMQISDDPALMAEIEKKVFPRYINAGYAFLGGNPDAGLLVFVRGIEIPETAENRQKLAKLLLRGGVQLKGDEPIRARLVRFPKELDGKSCYRDGLFAVMKRGIQSALARNNGIGMGHVWQATLYRDGEFAIKGTMMGATPDNPSTMKLLRGDDMVIDVEEFNKIFGGNYRHGDVIEIDPEDIWVMRTSGEKGKKPVHISAQAIRRAPAQIAEALHRLNMAELNGFIKACASDDKRALYNYMPKFGQYRQIIKAGLRPMLNQVWKDGKFTGEYRIDPYLEKTLEGFVIRGNRKGWFVPGWSEYIIHDNTLSVDTGNQVPGVSVPESWGKKVGDTLVMLAYPILPALDAEGRSTGIFTVKVERLNKADFVGIHPQAAKWALRDEDGDQPIFIELNSEPIGIAHLDLSTKVDGDDGELRSLFKAEMSGDLEKDAKAVLRVYSRLATDVGTVDNRVTSVMLYLGGRTVDTPTGEPMTVYLSKVIQASIESKKHITDPVYSRDMFDAWLRIELPDAFDPETGSFQKHPELDCQKVYGPTGTFEGATLEDVKVAVKNFIAAQVSGSPWMEMVFRSLEWKVTQAGFVKPEFYKKAGTDLYKALQELVESKERRAELGKMVDQLVKSARLLSKASGWDAAKKWLAMKGAAFSMELPPAEWALMQAMMVFATRNGSPIYWLNFCSVDFLQVLSYFAENPEDDPWKRLGLTRRNKTTVASRESSVDLDPGIARVRLWVSGRELNANELAEGQVVAFMGEKAMADNQLYNVDLKKSSASLIGAYVIASIEQRTPKGATLLVKAAE